MILNQVKTEQVVVASIMDAPTWKLGPNICSALVQWPYWASVEAARIADAIESLTWAKKVPSRAMVKASLTPEYKPWVDHPSFKDGLPIAMAEHEAFDLLPYYSNKRIIDMVAATYQQMIDHPEQAHTLATRLREDLSGL